MNFKDGIFLMIGLPAWVISTKRWYFTLHSAPFFASRIYTSKRAYWVRVMVKCNGYSMRQFCCIWVGNCRRKVRAAVNCSIPFYGGTKRENFYIFTVNLHGKLYFGEQVMSATFPWKNVGFAHGAESSGGFKYSLRPLQIWLKIFKTLPELYQICYTHYE